MCVYEEASCFVYEQQKLALIAMGDVSETEKTKSVANWEAEDQISNRVKKMKRSPQGRSPHYIIGTRDSAGVTQASDL